MERKIATLARVLTTAEIKRKAVSGIMLTLLLMAVPTSVLNFFLVKATPERLIYIKADGSIDPPTAPIQRVGDVYTFTDDITSLIYDGIVVQKSNIVIDGNGYELDGPGKSSDYYGVWIEASNVTIKNTYIKEWWTGIWVNPNGLHSSSNNKIYSNNITDVTWGISLDKSSYNTIYENNIGITQTYNNAAGILISSGALDPPVVQSCYNEIYENNITHNSHGIFVDDYSDFNVISRNNVSENTDGIYLDSCSDNTVSDNILWYNFRSGVTLSKASYNIISKNSIMLNEGGISLDRSHNNTIIGLGMQENAIAGNDVGILLRGEACDNNISDCRIFVNVFDVYLMNASSNNKFYHNLFTLTHNGIYDASWDNPGIPPSVNTWDDGYPSGGNCWSGHTKADEYHGPDQDQLGGDGIADESYVIDENNEDKYPLTLTSKLVEANVEIDGTPYVIMTRSNVTLTNVIADKSALHFTASGDTGQTGYISTTIPVGLNTTEIQVFLDGEPVTPPVLIITTDGTHYFIYFKFTLSTRDIIIQYAVPARADVAVTNVTPSKTVVCQGYSMPINVIVENQGNVPETFNVTTYYGGTIPNGDFEKDPAGTSYNDITNWNYSTIVHKGNPPTGDDLQIVDDYYFKGDKSLYSYLQTTSVSPSPGDNWVSQYLSTEEPVFTAADYISVWIGGDDYTISSRYTWHIALILADGTNTYEERLRCNCWGNNEGCNPNNFDYYNATETGADGKTWKRYTRRIPDSLDKSNLTIKIKHYQASWDETQASSWYHLDNIYFSDSEGNPTIIETKTVTNLPPGEETTITFTWNTTGLTEYKNYTISAYAHPVPGEIATADNTFIDDLVLMVHVGDINGDGKVRVDDILIIAMAFGSEPGHPRWDPNADINCDDKVRVDDILAAALQFGWG